MASNVTLVFDDSYSITVAIIVLFFKYGFIIDVRHPNVSIVVKASSGS